MGKGSPPPKLVGRSERSAPCGGPGSARRPLGQETRHPGGSIRRSPSSRPHPTTSSPVADSSALQPISGGLQPISSAHNKGSGCTSIDLEFNPTHLGCGAGSASSRTGFGFTGSGPPALLKAHVLGPPAGCWNDEIDPETVAGHELDPPFRQIRRFRPLCRPRALTGHPDAGRSQARPKGAECGDWP